MEKIKDFLFKEPGDLFFELAVMFVMLLMVVLRATRNVFVKPIINFLRLGDSIFFSSFSFFFYFIFIACLLLITSWFLAGKAEKIVTKKGVKAKLIKYKNTTALAIFLIYVACVMFLLQDASIIITLMISMYIAWKPTKHMMESLTGKGENII